MASINHEHHSMPKWILIPSNAVTTFQVVNIGCLLWWTVMLYTNGYLYERSNVYKSLGWFAPSIEWWTMFTGIVLLCNLLPIIGWWSTHINRTYRTKSTGLLMSVFWWAYIASAFAIGQGFDLGFGIHAVLALGASWEVLRLVRGRV